MEKEYAEAVRKLFHQIEEVDAIRNEIKEEKPDLFLEIEETERQLANNVGSSDHTLNFETVFDYIFEYNWKLNK